MRVLAVWYDRWEVARGTPSSTRHPLRLWMKAVWFKANPRPAQYMGALLTERYPDATLIDADAEALTARSFAGASRVVLLYPDSIGLGFAPIERAVGRHAPNVTVEVLNGRRRQFPFDARTKWALRLRRFVEVTMLMEFAITAVMIIATPFLLALDYLRGRS